MDILLNWVSSNSSIVYVFLFAYCFLKSGALPLFAGVLVGTGSLTIGPVVAACFLGAYLGDELRFFLGRKYAEPIKAKWPKTSRFIETGRALLTRYGQWYIFLYRYPKGMRTIGAFPVGMSDMTYKRFFLLNSASATIWVTLLVGAGFWFGSNAEKFGHEYYGLISIILFLIFLAVIVRLFKKSFHQDRTTSLK